MKNKKIIKLPELTLIFPAYNEAGNVEEAVKQAQRVLPKIAEKFEIIIVNDGSTDLTLQIAKRLAQKDKNLKILNQRNKGYGGAIKSGFRKAKFDWIFFTDCDLQFDLEELEKFVPYHKDNELILGFRKNRAEGKKRRILANLLKIWNYVLLGFPKKIKDIDCAFKLFNKNVLKTVEPLISDGALISTEFLIKAHNSGFRYTQIGVKHYKRHSGVPTGSSIKVILRAILDTFILMYNLRRGNLNYKISSVKTTKFASILR